MLRADAYILNYKLKRYSDALYPRKYKSLGCHHTSQTYGIGQVTKFDALKEKTDMGQQKNWVYNVQYKSEDGSIVEEKVKMNACDTAIIVFPDTVSIEDPKVLPKTFSLAPFFKDHLERLADQKLGIQKVFASLCLEKTHRHDLEWWDHYFHTAPKCPSCSTDGETKNTKPFEIPTPHLTFPSHCQSNSFTLSIDSGKKHIKMKMHNLKFKFTDLVAICSDFH